MEHSPGLITLWAMKQILINFKTDVIQSIFSDHNAVRLEINYQEKNYKKKKNTWRLNNMLLNNQCIIGEIKQEIKNAHRQMKMKAH